VCARVGSLPELLGPAAAWSEDDSAQALGAALATLLSDSQFATLVSDGGLAQARALPTWSEVAAVTLRAYREALTA
jgi:glycosyltransferase involved in cell wall biosynthesis